MKVNVSATVYSNRRDVTKWVESLTVGQEPRTLYRFFEVTLRGWHSLEDGGRWDIYGSYGSTARAEILIRQGIIPDDTPPRYVVERGEVVGCTVKGYDWAYRAQRITPKHTVVIAPSLSQAKEAVSRSDYTIGRWVYYGADTMHSAVRHLGALAGVHVDIRIPNYKLAPWVADPTKTVWEDIVELVGPFRPECYFRRTSSTVLIADRIGRLETFGSTMSLGAGAVASFEVEPLRFRTLSRVLITVPRWVS